MGPCQEPLIFAAVLFGCCCACAGIGNGTTGTAARYEPLSATNLTKEFKNADIHIDSSIDTNATVWETDLTNESDQADILKEATRANSRIGSNTTVLETDDGDIQDGERLKVANATNMKESNTKSDVVKIQLKGIQTFKKIFQNRPPLGGSSETNFDANNNMQNNSYLNISDAIIFEKHNSSENVTAIHKNVPIESFVPGNISHETLNTTKVIKNRDKLNVTNIKEDREMRHKVNADGRKKTLNATNIDIFENGKTSTETIVSKNMSQQTVNATYINKNHELLNATNIKTHKIVNISNTNEKQEKSTEPPVFVNVTEYLNINNSKTHGIKYLNFTTSGYINSNGSILTHTTTAFFPTNQTTEATKGADDKVLREWSADTVPLPRHHDLVAMGNDPFESLIWKDKRYLISVLIPICIGVFGAIVIVVATYVARSCPRLPRQTQDIVQRTFSQSENISTRDNVLLLIDTSEDDM